MHRTQFFLILIYLRLAHALTNTIFDKAQKNGDSGGGSGNNNDNDGIVAFAVIIVILICLFSG